MWSSMIAGKSGVDYITSFDTTDYEVKIAAEVRGFDMTPYVTRKQAQRMDRFTRFAVAASLQAVEAARLTIDAGNENETGIIIGNSVCGLLSVCEEMKVLATQGPSRISPILAPTMIGDAAAVQVSMLLGAKGVSYAPSSACSSASDAIGHAFALIQRGMARIVIAGAPKRR
jgi:3-oxoacyl-[acyl-carrier-protein] synthase II